MTEVFQGRFGYGSAYGLPSLNTVCQATTHRCAQAAARLLPLPAGRTPHLCARPQVELIDAGPAVLLANRGAVVQPFSTEEIRSAPLAARSRSRCPPAMDWHDRPAQPP